MSCFNFARELAKLVAEDLRRKSCDCLLFSGGIDTTFVLLSSRLFGMELRPFSLTPLSSPDYQYLLYVSEKLNVKVINIMPKSKKVIENCIDVSILKLKTIDPVEIASALSVCLGLFNAKSYGCKCVATGDGGDELFLGYNFLLKLNKKELEEWQRRMAEGKARFNSKDIGKEVGIDVEWPLYSEEVREFSLRVPLSCKISKVKEKTYGKYLMRKFLELNMLDSVAWREKTPITHGSMALTLLKTLSRNISTKRIKELESITDVKLPSREHAYLLNRYLALGLKIPEKCEDPERRCPICGSCMEGNHCKFCGAYLSKNGELSVYRGG